MEVFAVARSPSLSSLPVVVLAYKTTRPPRKNNASPPRKQKPPTIAEVQRAIGVADEPLLRSPGGSDSSSSSSPPFLGFFMQESAAERKLREAAEWIVERTESQAQSGQKMLLLLCLNILPVWLLLLLVASGVFKLPFDLPFWKDIIS
ncbi:putative NAD(P)H dehydrogenase subunit CRR3, chloroplastic [Curcuma longa]|uniref:putative NAD(P)H dehydrogenase subunit CRR3, chloroplastic n=1 Tax=Curcuma longa TaxID=136217 RepID=UPI003D9F36DB